MEELNRKILTNLSQIPYSKEDGDIFMGENDEEELGHKGPSKNEQPPQPEKKPENQPKPKAEEGSKKGDSGDAAPTPKEPTSKEGKEKAETKKEVENSEYGLKMPREEFVKNLDKFIVDFKTQEEFKPILSRAKFATSPDEIAEHYGEIARAYGRLKDALVTQEINLQPSQDPKKQKPLPEEDVRKLAEIRKRLEELKTEVNTIEALFQAQMPVREDADEENLANAINERHDRLMELPKNSPQKEVLEGEINALASKLSNGIWKARQSPENTSISDNVLRAIGKSEFETEKFIGRLLATRQPEKAFQIYGLYGGVNLDVFLKVNQDMSLERMNRLQNLVEGNEAFHNMNYIIKRSFDNFVDQSKVLLPSHFEVIGAIPGVRDVFLAYESLTNEELAIETRILESEEKAIETEVDRKFREMWAKGTLNIPGLNGRPKMEDWELNRALIYGRNLFKTSVRAAEIMAQSELSPDEEKFVSPPQKELTQLLHAFKYVVMRFKPNESRGGTEIAKEVLAGFKKKRRAEGKVRIKTLGGTDVDMGTMQTIINPRGVFATWRLSRALLKEIKFTNPDGTITDVTQFFEDNAKQIERLNDLGDNKDRVGWEMEYQRATKIRKPKGEIELREYNKALNQWKKAKVKEFFKPLLNGNKIALGVLVSGNGLIVPTELKEIIWEEIAQFNPGAMASILTRLEVDDDKEMKGKEDLAGVEAMEDILLRVWGTPEQERILGKGKERQLRKDIAAAEEKLKELERKEGFQKGRISEEDVGDMKDLRENIDGMKKRYEEVNKQLKLLLRNEKWKKLKEKIKTANTSRLNYEVDRINKMKAGVDVSKFPVMTREKYLEGMGLSDLERETIDSIEENGKRIAGDLSNIAKSTTWFLDDVPLEIMKWTNLGQFYDRETNDLANFSKAAQELMKVVAGDPFSKAMNPHKVLEAIRAAMDASGQVLGLEPAQKNMEPVLTQYLEMIYEEPKSFWKKQIIWSAIQHSRRHPTSRAQEITGSVDAPSLNRAAMFELVEDALHMGAYRKEVRDKNTHKLLFESTEEKAEKKFKLQWYHRLIEDNSRDYGPFFLAAFFIQFFKDLFKDTFSGK